MYLYYSRQACVGPLLPPAQSKSLLLRSRWANNSGSAVEPLVLGQYQHVNIDALPTLNIGPTIDCCLEVNYSDTIHCWWTVNTTHTGILETLSSLPYCCKSRLEIAVLGLSRCLKVSAVRRTHICSQGPVFLDHRKFAGTLEHNFVGNCLLR